MFSPLRRPLVVISCLVVLASLTLVVYAQNVTTWHNDNNRTGLQSNEGSLRTGNVTQTGFGLLWQWGSPSTPLAGRIYAQPLAVTLPQSVGTCANPCSLVFIATEQDMLYAFDASPSAQCQTTCHPLVWSLSLGTPIDCTNPPFNFMICKDTGSSIVGQYIGVTGTPVIDSSSKTLYVVAAVETPTNAPPPPLAQYLLFAVDITTGLVKSSTVISGSVPGLAPSASALCGTSSGNGTVTFDVNHLQRSALLLLPSNGVVYVGFAAGPVDDVGEFNNGWLFAYKLISGGSFSFTQTAIFNTTPNGTGGGIWASGGGPASPSNGGYIYLATSNGTFDLSGVQNPSIDAGDTLLKLNPSNLAILDYYTPSDVFSYNSNQGLCQADKDFGSGGVLLPPDYSYNGKNVVINADKQSNLYVADQANPGKFNSTTNCTNTFNNIQCIQTPSNGGDLNQGYWGSPAYWHYKDQNSADHYMLYYSVTTDNETSHAPLPINGYQLNTTPPSAPIPSQYASTSTLFCQYSPTPSVSSSGTVSSSGIVWAIEQNQNSNNPSRCDGTPINPAALHAFNASNLAAPELYHSSGSDGVHTAIGHVHSFPTPTIFKGQVYMGTDTEVDVWAM